jgi:hypothetical protein
MIGGGLAIPLSLSSDGTLAAQGIRAGYIGQVPSTQSGQSFAESSNHEQLQGTSFADKATAELPFGINSSDKTQIVVDKQWLATASPAEIEAVLLEELGHVIDHALNGFQDSPGDEGELFSAALRGESPPARVAVENDQRWVVMDGLTLGLEGSLMQLPIPSAIAGIDIDGNSASPYNEGPANAFDGNGQTKYLNFGQAGSGLEFSYLRPTKIGSFVLTTANDEVGRDPASYSLYGFNSATKKWDLVASGAVSLPLQRLAPGEAISIGNGGYFSKYRLVFPAVRGNYANSMQIADASFYGAQQNTAIISSPADDNVFGLGEVISITASFLQPVKVTGTPTLLLKAGEIDRPAIYSSISEDGKILTFLYTVKQGDSSLDLDVASASSLQLPSQATIKDLSGVDAVLALPVGADTLGSLANSKNLVLDCNKLAEYRWHI